MRRLTILLVFAAAVLGACGSDGDSETTTTTAATSSTTAAAKPAASPEAFCAEARAWWDDYNTSNKSGQDRARVAMTRRHLVALATASPAEISADAQRLSQLYGEIAVPAAANRNLPADPAKSAEMFQKLSSVEAYYAKACNDTDGLPEI